MSEDTLQDFAQCIVLHCVAFCAVLCLVLGNNLGSVNHFQALQGGKQNQMGLQGQEAFVAVFLDCLFSSSGILPSPVPQTTFSFLPATASLMWM